MSSSFKCRISKIYSWTFDQFVDQFSGLEWIKINQNGSEWIRMDKIDQNESKWIRMDQNRSEWIGELVFQRGSKRFELEYFCFMFKPF